MLFIFLYSAQDKISRSLAAFDDAGMDFGTDLTTWSHLESPTSPVRKWRNRMNQKQLLQIQPQLHLNISRASRNRQTL